MSDDFSQTVTSDDFPQTVTLDGLSQTLNILIIASDLIGKKLRQ
jgi:hypothetical protein